MRRLKNLHLFGVCVVLYSLSGKPGRMDTLVTPVQAVLSH